MSDNRYVQAAQDDYQALKDKWDGLRQKMQSNDDGGNGKPDSRLAETAWADFKDQSEKMRAAGSTASDELRGSYQAARDKVRNIVESYQRH